MDRPPEQTVFSLSDDVPEPQDFADAHALSDGKADVSQTVLARGAVGELCSVRKLSKRGAVLHTNTPVVLNQHLSFELMNGRAISGTVSWVRGSEVILRFADDLDVLGVIAAELVSQPGERRRMPRVELRGAVRLHLGPRVVNAGLVDLSQGGVKLALREALEVGTPLTLSLSGFRPLPATVRWWVGGHAGLLFDEELGWQEMMPWLRSQSTPASAAAARTLEPRLPSNEALAAGDPQPTRGPADMSPVVELNIPARIREGAERWNVSVIAITTTHATFESYTRPRFGTLISIALPGLSGWPAKVTSVDGDRWTCEFAQRLHPAVLDRMLANGR